MNDGLRTFIRIVESADERAARLYHGTPKTAAADSILRSGQLVPGAPQGRARLAAVAGAVFLTPDLPYSISFATGKAPGTAVWPDRDEPFGYVFEAAPSEGATMQPDEDSVGMFARQHVDSRRSEFAYRRPYVGSFDPPEIGANATDDEHIEMLRWMRQAVPNDKLWGEIGWFDRMKELGKRALKKMPPERKRTFIDWGAHIAHHGPVGIRAAWKIEKTRNSELTPDASNFFEIAEPLR